MYLLAYSGRQHSGQRHNLQLNKLALHAIIKYNCFILNMKYTAFPSFRSTLNYFPVTFFYTLFPGTMPGMNLKKSLLSLLTFVYLLLIVSNLSAQTPTPCNQRVIDNVDFSYNGGTAPARWNMSQTKPSGFSIDQIAYNYVTTGNFSDVNLNSTGGGTNNATHQYAITTDTKNLSTQYANIPTDGMIVINPLQGQNDQYATYTIAGLIPGNVYTVEIKVWNVINLAMPGACGQWCNWNDQLLVDWAGNGNNAHDGLGAMNWTGTNGSGGWNGYGNQIDKIMKISAGGASAVMTADVTLANATTGFTITFKKGNSVNPIVLGIDYIKVYGCQAEDINISGGSTSVCEASDITLTAQGLGPAGSSYKWYKDGTLLAGMNTETINIVTAIGVGTKVKYEAIGDWSSKIITLTSKLCCSSVGGTSDEVIRQSFDGLTYTCPVNTGGGTDGSRHGGYADIPDKGTKNFINGAYTYAGIPCNTLDDGQYAVVQSSFAGNFWQNRAEVKEHTGKAGSGALFVNAKGGAGQNFYSFDLTTGLCNETRYEFSAWYASLAGPGEIIPNIEFDVMNGATKVESVTSGVIAVNEKWYEASVTFVTPKTGNPAYTLQIINLEGKTGGGNDVMIDDIVVKKCTPTINLYPDGTKDTALAVCNNNPVNLKVSTYYDLPLAITGSSTGTVYFQWMKATSPGGPWTLIGTPETTGSFSATPIPTTTYYRAKVSGDATRAATGNPPLASECGNDGMTSSFKLTKGGNFTVPPITGATAYCVGATMTLTGNVTTGDQWEWRKGASFATATVIPGYAYSTDVTKKEYSKTFTSGDAGNYYFMVKLASGCEGYATVAVTAAPVPTATIAGTTAVCQNATPAPAITFTGANGTAPYTFTYNIDGGADKIVTTVSGNSATVPAPTSATGVSTYTLTDVKDASTSACSNTVTGQTAKITVNVLPTATISGTTTVQVNAPSPNITFTGADGTAPYTFTYNINGGTNKTITTASGNSVTVAAPTTTGGSFVYNLVSVKDASATTCSSTSTGSATITISDKPGAAISGTAAVCKNATAPVVTFTGSNGTAPYTFTYNINGGTDSTVKTVSGNSVTVTAPTDATGTFVYTLTLVKESSATPITNPITGQSITITVNDLPAITGGTTSMCKTGTTQFTGSGTAAASNPWISSATSVATVDNTGKVTSVSAGTSVITYTNDKGCTTNIPITVSDQATINGNTNICLGSASQLTGSGTAAASNAWVSASPSVATVDNTGNVTSVSAGISVITYTTDNGCSKDVTLTVNPIPVSHFRIAQPAFCSQQTINFIDESSAGVNSWTWDFGDGAAPLSQQNPSHVYAAEGSFSISLDVKDNHSCTTSFDTSIIVGAAPQPGFTIPPICISGGSTAISLAATNSGTATIDPTTGWKWVFDDGTVLTGTPISYNYTTGGPHTVKLIGTSTTGCMDSLIQSDTAYNVPIAKGSIPNDIALCSSQPVTLINESSVIGSGSISKVEIFWDYVNNPTPDTTDNSPVANGSYTHHYPALATDNIYQVRINPFSGNGCPTTPYDTTITVHGSPTVQFAPVAPVCQETAPFALTGGLPAGGSYRGNGVINDSAFSPQLAGPGSYRVIYTFTSVNGCFDTAMQTISVYPTPVVDYGGIKGVLERDSTKLAPITANGTGLTYLWTPATYLSSNTSAAPIVKPAKDISYTIQITSDKGCIATQSLDVKVLIEFLVPNTFTPNNDGINDFWVIEELPVYPIQRVQVFNRYGQVVFESTNYSKPWDGNYKGKSLPSGTYYYIIELGGWRDPKTGYVTIIK